MIASSALAGLSTNSRKCIERLSDYQLEEKPDLSSQSVSKLAAVLVVLFERSGELRVLLTTRSKTLRSHPGQTALPGGKVDETDGDFVQTAYREAYEEVAFPLDCSSVHTICTLEPFISKYKLLVTPVIALLTDLSVLYRLKASEAEVDHIFDHPLEALLDPSLASKEQLVKIGSDDWPYEVDYHNSSDVPLPWLGDTVYRMHRFRSVASPVKGLTSDILIKTAEIAYKKDPTYERYSPQQAVGFIAIHRLLTMHANNTTNVGEDSTITASRSTNSNGSHSVT